ncbi:MAG: hypothetical protein NVS1B10_04220 [Candidatus Saccharimonadales bacterium]
MSGTKSISRNVGAEVYSGCGAHQLVIPTPDQLSTYEHSVSMEELVGGLESGNTLVAPSFESVLKKTKTVEIYKDKLIEERRSAHGVTFGRLITSRTVADRTDHPAMKLAYSVALKPFVSSEDAVREMRGYFTLQNLNVPTFEPVGIFQAAKGEHFVGMTIKNNDLLSLDQHKWVKGRAIRSENEVYLAEHNDQQVRGISETLAFIHANGVFHPDGQIKNFVATASDKIGVIDTEKQIIRPLGDDEANQIAWQDIEHLVKSLIIDNYAENKGKLFGVGMLANLPLQVVRASIEDLIIHPYIAKLESLLDDDPDTIQAQQIECLYDGISEKFYSDTVWPQHFIDVN